MRISNVEHRVLVALLALWCTACGGGGQRPSASTSDAVAQTQPTDGFRMVEIPKGITDPKERIAYMADNYWNRFDFSDTSLIRRPEVTEQAFTNYLYTLGNAGDTAVVGRSERKMLRAASVDSIMYGYFVRLYEKYLYDPNSPMRSEELYAPVLDALIASKRTAEADRIRFSYRRMMIDRNRPGTLSTDFRYTLASGATAMMHSVKAEFLLVYFNNPGCKECKETTEHIIASPLFGSLLHSGLLKILAVYPDEDVKAWHRNVVQMPSEWINAYDAGTVVRNSDLYDLRAIPCLYLLDRDKRVLLKDAPIDAVDGYLAAHTTPLVDGR